MYQKHVIVKCRAIQFESDIECLEKIANFVDKNELLLVFKNEQQIIMTQGKVDYVTNTDIEIPLGSWLVEIGDNFSVVNEDEFEKEYNQVKE